MTAAHLAGGATSCSVAAQVPSLPPQLRAIGGFDQPVDAGATSAIEREAADAAGAVSPDLIGAIAVRPVAVAASLSGRPDALVVPLLSAQTSGETRLAGLVAYLRDCAGRAYYSAVDDLTSLGTTAPPRFPSVSAPAAAAQVQTASPELVYTTSPFMPEWRNPSTGATIPAFG